MQLSAMPRLPNSSDVLLKRSEIAANTVDGAHDVISKLFCEHKLVPLETKTVRMKLRSAQMGSVALHMLTYGEAVRISPIGLGSFHLVQIPLRGHASMTIGGVQVDSSSLVATVPPLDRDFSMRWERNSPHLIVFIKHDEISRIGNVLSERSFSEDTELTPMLRLNTSRGQAFLRSVLELHDLLDLENPEDDYSRKLAAELMVIRLLTAVDDSAGALVPTDVSKSASSRRGETIYRRYLAMIEESVELGDGVVDIAKKKKVPTATLR